MEKEITTKQGLRVRVTFLERDGRRPDLIALNPNEPEIENIYRIEVYDEPTETWFPAREEIIEYLEFERNE